MLGRGGRSALFIVKVTTSAHLTDNLLSINSVLDLLFVSQVEQAELDKNT